MFVDYTPDKQTECCVCKMAKLCQWNDTIKRYICKECLGQGCYSAKNKQTKGTQQKRLPTFSVEFEVQQPSAEKTVQLDQALLLLRHQFIRTYDSTVAEEYKSPLYLSLAAFYPALSTMHQLSSLVGEQCGTHIHVECQVKDKLRQCFGEVFGPLIGHLLTHPHETLIFWGRTPNPYASHRYNGRYFLFNISSGHPTLEFRLPRFRNKEQYLAVVKFARSCTAFLDKHLPQASKKPRLLPVLGQELLTLYQTYLPQDSLTWFAALPKKQQENLQEAIQVESFGWKKRL